MSLPVQLTGIAWDLSDTVTIEIENIGALTNPVALETI